MHEAEASVRSKRCYAIVIAIVIDSRKNSTNGPYNYCLYDHYLVCFFSIIPSAECQ